jgi:hypothetical protein
MFGKKKDEPKLSDDEKDARVVTELSEAKKCIQKDDRTCTASHLKEAQKHEDCRPCRGQIKDVMRIAPVSKEKAITKTDYIIDVSRDAANVSRKFAKMKSIKLSRTERVNYNIKSVGRGFKKLGGKIANLFKS